MTSKTIGSIYSSLANCKKLTVDIEYDEGKLWNDWEDIEMLVNEARLVIELLKKAVAELDEHEKQLPKNGEKGEK